MPSLQLTNPGDIKLYILCIMQNVGYPLEYSDINDLVLYGGVVSNMDFIESFDSLERDGLVAQNKSGAYYVTDDGGFLGETLKSELLGYISDRGLQAALRSIDFRKAKVKRSAKITKQKDGKAKLDMTLSKDNEEFMKLSLVFDTEYQAKKAQSSFAENPELVYSRLVSLLGGE